MSDIQICDACLQAYEPELINGIRMLKVFNGYTIDLRLKQFRKITLNELLITR